MNILCIDMNIIMSPCIRLYMDRVAKHENPQIVWQQLEKSMGIGAHISYDAGILITLAKIIKANRSARLVMTEHQMENIAIIEELLEEERAKVADPPAVSIQMTNIDFFSDLGDPEERSRFEFGVYDDDSWFGYLFHKYPEYEYIWVKASESCISGPEIYGERLKMIPVSKAERIASDVDAIILSHSGQFVPYCYRHLGELLGQCAA